MIITNSRYALVGYFITSYPTRAHGIIVIYRVEFLAFPIRDGQRVGEQLVWTLINTAEGLTRQQGTLLISSYHGIMRQHELTALLF